MKTKLLLFTIFSSIIIASPNKKLYNKIEALDKKNKALFAEVKVFIDELVKDRKFEIETMYLDDMSSAKKLKNALDMAYDVARANGLNITKLKSLYKLSKKVILQSNFVTHDSLEAPTMANTFADWFDVTKRRYANIKKQRAKEQQLRVDLYKKTTIQFINALTQKDSKKAYEGFRAYANALRKIQSADADQLVAQADALVARQKLVQDIMSAVPVVGDSLDIIAIVSGVDLSGHQLSNLEKGISFIMLLTPEVLSQVIKRNPAISKTLGKISAGILDAPKKVLEKLAKKKASKDVLKKHLASLGAPSDEVLRWREFYRQNIAEKRAMSALDDKTKYKIARDVQEELSNTYKRSNYLSDESAQKLSRVAKDRDEIVIIRDVNKNMEKRLSEGAFTKGMNVKGKSKAKGVGGGLVPKNQALSKLKNPSEIAKFQKKVNESLKTEKVIVDGIEHTITPQQVRARQYIVNKGEKVYKGMEITTKNGKHTMAVFKTPGGRYVNENFKPISKKVLKSYNLKNAKPFEVLTDMKGNYLTADIDFLAIGSKKKGNTMQNDITMGNINSNEMQTVDAVNKAFSSQQHKGRLISHHGSEANFMTKSSKLDFPLSAYSPDGKVSIIKTEKELKRYFHMQKLKGYDLQPNPYWNWGKYDPKKGYK